MILAIDSMVGGPFAVFARAEPIIGNGVGLPWKEIATFPVGCAHH